MGSTWNMANIKHDFRLQLVMKMTENFKTTA